MKIKVFLLFVAAIIAAPAQAAKEKRIAAESSSEEPKNIIVEVPASDIDLHDLLSEKLPKSSASALALRVSSWSPDAFARSSFAKVATPFRSTGLPFLALDRLSLLQSFSGNGAALYWLAGLSYVRLQRSASAANLESQQTLGLASLRLGLQVEGPRFFKAVLSPFAGAALSPSYAFAAESEIEGRVSSFGFPYEISAGVLLRPGFLRNFWSFSDGSFGLGGHALFGTIDGASVRGLAIQGIFAVRL